MSNVTIGITSFNRGKYLDVLLESLGSLMKQHHMVLVDNCSTEGRIWDIIVKHKDYCGIEFRGHKEPNWVNDEYIAKNIIIEKAKEHGSDVILFLQDDLQFIGPDQMIQAYADVLMSSAFTCLTANGVRKVTLNNVLGKSTSIGKHKIWEYNDRHFHTMGFFKTKTFDEIGKYPVDWPLEQKFWGRSEDWYDAKVKERYQYVSATHHVPIFLPAWNDPRGGYAFLRDGKRYGHYKGPADGFKLFYDKMSPELWQSYVASNKPLSFAEVAHPLGWKLALDLNNDPRKFPQKQVMIDGPISEIDD